MIKALIYRFWKYTWNIRAKVFTDLIRVTGRIQTENEFQKLVDDVRRKLELASEDTLLDFGCAKGRMAVYLMSHVNSIVCVDYSPEMISKAREGSTFVKLEFYTTKLFKHRDNYFDKILVYSVIHYLNSKEELYKLLVKFYKTLKSGGVILIGDILNKLHKKMFPKRYFISKNKGSFFALIEYLIFFSTYHLWQWHYGWELIEMAENIGFDATILPQDNCLATSRDRFDLLLKKK